MIPDYFVLSNHFHSQTSIIVNKNSNNRILRTFDLNTFEKNEIIKEKIITDINSLKKISHKNIIPFTSYELNDNYIKIYRNFIEGNSLSEIIFRFGIQSEHDSLKILLNVLEILDHLHENNIYANSIKPENIIFNSHHFPCRDPSIHKSTSVSS